MRGGPQHERIGGTASTTASSIRKRLIEQTNEIVRRLNRQVGHTLLPEARALVPESGRLPGVDGRAKMSRSQSNGLVLSATEDAFRAAVRRMYTDRDHLRVTDRAESRATSCSPISTCSIQIATASTNRNRTTGAAASATQR
ncbi:hypothetical protein [Methylobacterium brachiatum]